MEKEDTFWRIVKIQNVGIQYNLVEVKDLDLINIIDNKLKVDSRLIEYCFKMD